jgi:hypothetical protein
LPRFSAVVGSALFRAFVKHFSDKIPTLLHQYFLLLLFWVFADWSFMVFLDEQMSIVTPNVEIEMHTFYDIKWKTK